jgi:hypothetical protein
VFSWRQGKSSGRRLHTTIVVLIVLSCMLCWLQTSVDPGTLVSVVAFDAVVAVASLEEGPLVQMATFPGGHAMDEVSRAECRSNRTSYISSAAWTPSHSSAAVPKQCSPIIVCLHHEHLPMPHCMPLIMCCAGQCSVSYQAQHGVLDPPGVF